MNKGHPHVDVQETAVCMGLELEKIHLQIISVWMANETQHV